MRQNFSRMTVEELVALQETADEETVKAIEAELDRRDNENKAGETTEDNLKAETGETTEEPAAMTDVDALFAECQKNVGHRCRLVPAGTIEYADGTIVGCVKIKRSGAVAYAIKLDNGKRVTKNYKAPLFEILDEVVERAVPARRTFKAKAEKKVRVKAEPWSEERMAEEVAKYIGNVGRAVLIKGDEGSENFEGKITAIVPIRRSNSILYRIEVPAPTEEDPNAVKVIHKSVANTDGYGIALATAESEAFNAAYMARREKLAERKPKTGAELILDLELKLEKAREAVKKAEERVASLEKAVAEKKAETEGDEPKAETEDML